MSRDSGNTYYRTDPMTGALIEVVDATDYDRLLRGWGALFEDLAAFAGLLEAEWYNGNLDERAYTRLNRDLGGVIAKHRQPTLPLEVSA